MYCVKEYINQFNCTQTNQKVVSIKNGSDQHTYPSAGFLLASPVSTSGPPTSTSAPLDSGLGLGFSPGFPEAMDSCLASTRCRSSFNANPWHSSDSSLKWRKNDYQSNRVLKWEVDRIVKTWDTVMLIYIVLWGGRCKEYYTRTRG